MQFGHLSEHFSTFAWKRVTEVEVNPNASNGHEFNSSSQLREILGHTTRSCSHGTGIPTKFVYLSDTEDQPSEATACMSWYDARANHPTRTEWRLYYTDNVVIGREGRASANDFLVIAFSAEKNAATVLVAEAGSTSESQLRWLFGISEGASLHFETAHVETAQIVDLARGRILEAAGIVLPANDDDLLGRMLQLFGEEFPTSSRFSSFVRSETPEVIAADDPDSAIIAWMEREEFAFRVLERHIVWSRVSEGFESVDDFVNCSLSVHNRRKSRAGYAFENHLGEVFRSHGLAFARTVAVEDRSKPDFLFPGGTQYYDPHFPVGSLTLLGAKTSCKDRWRQVLAESSRVTEKHLVTLEPAISGNQLAQMRAHHLQLVVPGALHATYPLAERGGLWDMNTFISSVRQKQSAAGIADDFTDRTTVPRRRKRR